MRLGLYGPHELPAPRAFAAGAELLGYSLQWREPARFNVDQVEDLDLVLVDGGLRGPLGQVARSYTAAGVPVLVMDLGFLRRDTYHQFGVGRLNWVPEAPCPGDRFAALGLQLTLVGPTGGHILLCGQVPDDSAHGLGLRELNHWLEATVLTIRRHTRQRIVFRPHPLFANGQAPRGVDDVASPLMVTLDTCLRDALAVVSINSNAGHEALLAGVPVFCRPGSGAAYEALAETDLSRLARPEPPSPVRRQEYFNRLAYGQWSLGELETGEPLRFLRDRGLIPGG